MQELDVLRGITVAAMILVVSPGAWEFTYTPLQHADWHGWTFADLVFPDFLFGVGMALGLAFGRLLDPQNSPSHLWSKVFRRVLGLLALGLALNYLAVIAGMLGAPPAGPEDYTSLRIPGVLQRIAICYLLAVIVLTTTATRKDTGMLTPNLSAIALIIVACLVSYWALLTFVPVPGFGAGDLSKAGNLPAYIDRAVFTPRHLWPLGAETWRGPTLYDPEGLLSSLPATANVLFGVLAVRVWIDRPHARNVILIGLGIALVVTGIMLDSVFPINKKLWTSSFALFTSGISCLFLIAVATMMRIGLTPVLWPFRVLGGNAITAFSMSIFLLVLSSIPMIDADGLKTLQWAGFQLAKKVIADPYIASLMCAFTVLAFITALIWPLHHRGIHIRL